MQKAGPAFEAYAAGKRETALVIFMNAVSGLEWEACRTLLDTRIPGAVAAAIKDADTFFGIELPALSAWTLRRCGSQRHLPAGPFGIGQRD